MQLESYMNKELQTISSREPKYQELKLQVYRDVFGCFIKEFKTYQPLLSAIKKEYENTLAYQQDQIRELEPLRSRLRLVTEECDRKIQARWAEEQAEIGALKREKQQLQKDIEAMREKEKATQAVVDHLQSELSNQYLQYRDERDARQLLIWQLNDLTRGSVKEEHPADENTEGAKDLVELQLTLKVCRKDLTKAQEELNRMKAEYWDVVPRRNWDTLEQTNKQNLLQLKTLQGDFDQLKSEYDTLLELHKTGSMQTETHEPVTVQMDESLSQGQSQIQSDRPKDPINSDAPKSGTLTVQEFRTALRSAFPLKSDQEIDELVASAQSKPDNSNDAISSQRLHSLLAESGAGALSQALEESEENAASNPFPASD
ncbi:translin-associated factor X-interacting protein 1 isoform X2 [Anoplopoma fimbria]|nr:translin-associated factor X-interacting protein 1 isoform X2 [Anoplopoma fimbria]